MYYHCSLGSLSVLRSSVSCEIPTKNNLRNESAAKESWPPSFLIIYCFARIKAELCII